MEWKVPGSQVDGHVAVAQRIPITSALGKLRQEAKLEVGLRNVATPCLKNSSLYKQSAGTNRENGQQSSWHIGYVQELMALVTLNTMITTKY